MAGFLTFLGGLANSLGGVVSNLFTNRSNRTLADNANTLQAQMFQQANAFNRSERLGAQQFNEAMMDKQMKYETDMWNANNAYNSPVAQAERLRAAGLNPSNIINGADTAQMVSSPTAATSSPASSASPPAMAVPSMQSPYDPSALSQTIATLSEARKSQAEVKGMEIDNETRAAKNLAELGKLIADKEAQLSNKSLTDAERRYKKQELKYLRIQYVRAKFASNRDQVVSDQQDQQFNAVMRQMEDQHTLAVLQENTQNLMNAIAQHRDKREAAQAQKTLQLLTEQIKTQIETTGYVNMQKLKTELEKNGIGLKNMQEMYRVGQVEAESNYWTKYYNEESNYIGFDNNTWALTIRALLGPFAGLLSGSLNLGAKLAK